MTNILVQDIEKKFVKKLPVIRPGYTVRISQKIREGEKERVQVFEGLVLGFNGGHGASKMMTVRKIVEGIGVEKTFPLLSAHHQIQITKTPKVRRAKLFYMRGLAGKSYPFAHSGWSGRKRGKIQQ
ncbi:MAG: 50S ribosomal protein L19 [Candidatus Gracilibacteria bacterium]